MKNLNTHRNPKSARLSIKSPLSSLNRFASRKVKTKKKQKRKCNDAMNIHVNIGSKRSEAEKKDARRRKSMRIFLVGENLSRVEITRLGKIFHKPIWAHERNLSTFNCIAQTNEQVRERSYGKENFFSCNLILR